MAGSDLLVATLDADLLIRMGVALSMGALIGLERERHREGGTVLAGIRTYPMVALAGVVLVHLGAIMGAPHVMVAVGAAIFALFAAELYWVRHGLGIHGITSPIALFVTFLTGAMIGAGLLLEGVIASVAVAVLLFTRNRLHRLAAVMTNDEMAGALQFTIVAFVLFPILADRAVDPWGVFNPKTALLIVVFVSTISFASFIAMRSLGAERGLHVMGMFGGLVSSEASTVSLAKMAESLPDLEREVVDAITLNNATMLIRNLVIAWFVFDTAQMAYLMGPAVLVMLGALLVFSRRMWMPKEWRRAFDRLVPGARYTVRYASASTTSDEQASSAQPDAANMDPSAAQEPQASAIEAAATPPKMAHDTHEIRLDNPFAIKPAFRFAVLFVVLQFVAFGLSRLPGAGEGAIVLTAAGGLVSSAAVIASVGALAATGQVSVEIASVTAVFAVVVSLMAKLIIVRAVHRPLVVPMIVRSLLPGILGMAGLLGGLLWVRVL